MNNSTAARKGGATFCRVGVVVVLAVLATALEARPFVRDGASNGTSTHLSTMPRSLASECELLTHAFVRSRVTTLIATTCTEAVLQAGFTNLFFSMHARTHIAITLYVHASQLFTLHALLPKEPATLHQQTKTQPLPLPPLPPVPPLVSPLLPQHPQNLLQTHVQFARATPTLMLAIRAHVWGRVA